MFFPVVEAPSLDGETETARCRGAKRREILTPTAMAKIIDLRKKDSVKPVASNSKTPVVPKGSVEEKVAPPLKQALSQISWETPSFYYNPQKKYLYILAGSLVAGGLLMMIYRQDMLTAIFLILSSLVMILLSSRRPEVLKIVVDGRGISAGDTFYDYKKIRSFWVFNEPGQFKELSLELTSWYSPPVIISLEKADSFQIRNFLIKYIREKEQEASPIDIIGRKIGL